MRRSKRNQGECETRDEFRGGENEKPQDTDEFSVVTELVVIHDDENHTFKSLTKNLENCQKEQAEESKKTQKKSAGQRDRDHNRLKVAQAKLEDFLYYQIQAHRVSREAFIPEEIDEDYKFAKEDAKKEGHKHAYKIAAGDEHSYHWVRQLLNTFDRRQVGGLNYALGKIDSLGNPIAEENRISPPRVGPEELHLWTPVCRREPRMVSGVSEISNVASTGVSLSPEEVAKIQEGLSEVSKAIPLEFNLDTEAIEKRRNEVDSKPKHQDDNESVADTHNARRTAELKRYHNNRPNTSNLDIRSTPSGWTTEDRWHCIRTEQGLFISAKETSRDWLTSYDCLDRVGRRDLQMVIPTSAVRCDAVFDTGDSVDNSGDAELGQDKSSKGDTETVDNNLPKEGKSETARLMKSVDTKDTDAMEDRTKARRSNRKRNGNYLAKDRPQATKKVRTTEKPAKKAMGDDELQFLNHQFTRPSKLPTFNLSIDPIDSTPWAEETDGRREWHIYHGLSPSSSVDSPPRSPLKDSSIAARKLDTLPTLLNYSSENEVWKVIPAGSELPNASLEPEGSRCQSNRQCRAWWPHPPAECWIVHSQKTHRLCSMTNVEPSRAQALEEKLRKIPETQNLQITETCVDIYRKRLDDHYGLKQAQWPKLGIRTPYEPTTYDDRKLVQDSTPKNTTNTINIVENAEDDIVAEDASIRAVFSFRTLDVPIIEITPGNESRKLGDDERADGVRIVMDHNKPVLDRDGDPDTDDESFDEHDVFRNSYLQGPLSLMVRPTKEV
ncbi:hypothetical protein GQ44DRAFT_764649 [Phaeosphaeriaceae sp. PMI808]|nr:hypothetical protein GQ44DRAFT_764649 [Phaeosphaeriaceae sp. PMI808]